MNRSLHLAASSQDAGMNYVDPSLAALMPGLAPQEPVLELSLPIAGPVAAQELLRLQGLMQRAGLSLQPTRMFYDRLYAFERLAAAYACADAELQDLALDLFERYQGAGEWIGLIH